MAVNAGLLTINSDRLKENLKAIGTCANSGKVGFTRLAYSAEEKAAADWLMKKLEALSLNPVRDAVGNIIAKWGDANKPSVAFGSHLDTVPQGGLYDGALGVVAGLECLQTMREAGYVPAVPLELIAFIGEEANALGGTFGSRAMAGLLPDTEEFVQRLETCGFSQADLVAAKRRPEDFRAFLELHIEQGPVLEQKGLDVGIVTAIAGILRLRAEVRGLASHSGTTPMHLRKDALVDAAGLVRQVHEIAANSNGRIVGTVGELSISPNLATVVPEKATLTVEFRGLDWNDMLGGADAIRAWVEQNIDATLAVTVEKRPVVLDSRLQNCLTDICVSRNISYTAMPSGANHDSNAMAALTAVGMLFVPSRAGLSHHPDEYTEWSAIEAGVDVLLQALLRLSNC